MNPSSLDSSIRGKQFDNEMKNNLIEQIHGSNNQSVSETPQVLDEKQIPFIKKPEGPNQSPFKGKRASNLGFVAPAADLGKLSKPVLWGNSN